MLKKLKISLLILFLFICNLGFSQTKVDREIFYKAFINGNIDKWDEYLKSVYEINPCSDSVFMDKLEYTFGIIGWYLKDKKIEKARYWNKRFLSLLEKKRAKDLNSPTIKAYYNAYLCYYVTIEKKHRIKYGRKAFNDTEKLVAEYPDNQIAQVLMGNIFINTPSLFGGSYSKAADCFKATLSIINKSNNEKGNWLYIYSILKLAEIYNHEVNLKEYEFYINKLKNIEPSISPNVINSIKQGK